ncbi:MAG: hypothetical protein R3E79_16790 [Caldilineaceae bacterium]
MQTTTPQATITLRGRGLETVGDLTVHVAVEATVNIDAKSARRQATIWLASEVGNMLIAGTPQLFISRHSVWRVPVLLTSSTVGTVGTVGVVDIDTVTGQLLVTDESKDELLANVARLIHPA